MENTAKRCTIVNYIFSGILWILGILTLLFNILGLWAAWHLVGFGFVFYIIFTIPPMLIAIIVSCIEKDKKMLLLNFIALVCSFILAIFTIFISSTWFW